MENENDDSQKTKLSENGTLCIGQKGSQKDLDLFPKKSRIGVDKTETIVYNTSMTNNNNNNSRKENNMLKKLFYSHLGQEVIIIASCIGLIIAGSIFGAWALLQTL